MTSKSKDTQIKRYGGEEGYRAEMRRRRSMVKKFALRDNPGLAKELANRRWNKNENRNTGQAADAE